MERDANLSNLDLSAVYALIDSILPFEACLYYQVLPLTIEGSRLVIGMVNPDDHVAMEYVKRQLAYINYSITTQAIASDWHRDLLSKYLSHHAKTRQQPATPAASVRPAAKVSKSTGDEQNNRPTLIVDRPDQFLEENRDRENPPVVAARPAPVESSSKANQTAGESPESTTTDPLAPSPLSTPPLHLQVDERHKESGELTLAALSPKDLMHALLSKVLKEGIGRLYFERKPQGGRILWSKDGVLQSVVESVDAIAFQGVINEFKLLTHLSLIPVHKPRQVEIERLYQDTRLLLRFRVMPTANGEEATLQVLRGSALRFYQQQQIDKLGRDALNTAQTLQMRLNAIRDRARQNLTYSPARSETLPALIELLKQMEIQVQEMIAARDSLKEADKPKSSPEG